MKNGDTGRLAENVTWRLEDLYSGTTDPTIDSDREWCIKQAERLTAACKGRMAELDGEALLSAVRHFESIEERSHKLLAYAYLNFSTRTHDAQANHLWQTMQEFSSSLRRETVFFELEWTQLEEETVCNLLSSQEIAPYRHYLSSLRRYKPYMLSEKEEQILIEKEPSGATAWCTLFDKILSQLRFGKDRRMESEVLSDLYHPEREVRKNAARELTEGLDGVLHILTHVFNTILLDKATIDRLRKYPHWLTAMNLNNEADDNMVEALAAAVTSRYDLVQRYYRLKRSLLGYDELCDFDRYAPVPGLPERTFSWEEARDTTIAAYERFSPQFGEIARGFFEKNWIHAPVLPGKRSGAFAHPTVPSAHPFVLLNYTGTQRDVMTLAHELGHGIHQCLARKQGLLNSETPLTTAESASVFGEMLVFRHVIERTEARAERLAILCGKIEDVFATVFRQISMNSFENAVHNERRLKGELDAGRLSDLWMETQRAMFGDAVKLMPHYGIWWSYIPHFLHSPGYVYAYAFGELLVLALFQMYKEKADPFVHLYYEFLESGGKASPAELLHPFGIDLDDPGFWRLGLTALEELVDQAEAEASASARSS